MSAAPTSGGFMGMAPHGDAPRRSPSPFSTSCATAYPGRARSTTSRELCESVDSKAKPVMTADCPAPGHRLPTADALVRRQAAVRHRPADDGRPAGVQHRRVARARRDRRSTATATSCATRLPFRNLRERRAGVGAAADARRRHPAGSHRRRRNGVPGRRTRRSGLRSRRPKPRLRADGGDARTACARSARDGCSRKC